jgi:hypothetical protein
MGPGPGLSELVAADGGSGAAGSVGGPVERCAFLHYNPPGPTNFILLPNN